MKAVCLDSPDTLKIETVPDPQIMEEDVLVKTWYCGICGSDLHRIRQGASPDTPNRVLGHEVVGEIIEIGTNVQSVSVGDMVVVKPLVPCNECKYCKLNQIQHCLNLSGIGKNLSGGFGEKFSVNANNVFKLTSHDKVGYQVCSLTDVVAVCVHAINLAPPLNEHSKVAIIGDGPIGITLQRVLKLRYNVNALLIHKHPYLKDILDPNTILDVNDVKEANYDMFDVVYEAVGGKTVAPMDLAISLAKKQGTIVSLGVYPPNEGVPIYLRSLLYKELSLIGSNSFGYDKSNRDEFAQALSILEEDIDAFKSLITHVFSYTDYNQAVDTFKNKLNSIKVLLDFTE